MAKVFELEGDQRALKGALEEKQAEIKWLKTEVVAAKKGVDEKVRVPDASRPRLCSGPANYANHKLLSPVMGRAGRARKAN